MCSSACVTASVCVRFRCGGCIKPIARINNVLYNGKLLENKKKERKISGDEETAGVEVIAGVEGQAKRRRGRRCKYMEIRMPVIKIQRKMQV